VIAPALRKIEAELIALAKEAAEGHRPDEYALRLIARKIEAQAELVEREIAE
jgi:hypothetical protein